MRTLVAGVGNIFFSDDGFGPEVVRALAEGAPIAGATVADYGIRGLHLAYELLSGYDRAILIDAVPRGGEPGTLYVLEPAASGAATVADAHRMDLQNVFALCKTIGNGDTPPPIRIVGCEPADATEGIGLSEAVRRAIAPAANLVRRLAEATDGSDIDQREVATCTEA